jgi:hypothetical protein
MTCPRNWKPRVKSHCHTTALDLSGIDLKLGGELYEYLNDSIFPTILCQFFSEVKLLHVFTRVYQNATRPDFSIYSKKSIDLTSRIIQEYNQDESSSGKRSFDSPAPALIDWAST